MKLYEYDSVPNLPHRVVDMANFDIKSYHQNRKAFDSTLIISVFRAQERVHLELLKMEHQGERVSDKWWQFGFVPKTETEFDDNLDAERLLVTRNNLRLEGRYQEADQIRKRLESWGYEIGDEPSGTNWLVVA